MFEGSPIAIDGFLIPSDNPVFLTVLSLLVFMDRLRNRCYHLRRKMEGGLSFVYLGMLRNLLRGHRPGRRKTPLEKMAYCSHHLHEHLLYYITDRLLRRQREIPAHLEKPQPTSLVAIAGSCRHSHYY